MQAKRIQFGDNGGADLGVGGQANLSLQVPTDPREEVNFHNIWASFGMEPTTADANANGQWVLYIIPKSTSGAPVISISALNLEVFNFDIIACGTWTASNQTPFTMIINPKTSRTIEAGGRLTLSVRVEGATAGNVSPNLSLCAHTTRK